MTEETEHAFSRTALLLGETGVRRLAQATVAVFGVGGVGSFAVEALVRAGVGRLVLVDNDRVHPTNLNRQLPALHSTLGRLKVEVMRERILDINPDAVVEIHPVFYLPGQGDELVRTDYNYIIDAIDTVTAKIDLIVQATEKGIPIISAMGAGNKLDPTRFEVADLADTSVCPLARVMRRELKTRGISHLKVVYSREQPVAVPAGEGKPVPGSLSFVPSVAGLILAGEVIKSLSSTASI